MVDWHLSLNMYRGGGGSQNLSFGELLRGPVYCVHVMNVRGKR